MTNLHESMWPNWGSKQRPHDSQSDTLLTALGGPAKIHLNHRMTNLENHVPLAMTHLSLYIFAVWSLFTVHMKMLSVPALRAPSEDWSDCQYTQADQRAKYYEFLCHWAGYITY